MKVAKVIGNIWATRKDESLAGLKLMILLPIDLLHEENYHTPIVAADIIGAGVGETVLFVSGSSARSAVGDTAIPVDATIVGIVDDKEINENVL
ncbi:EutN/CcmL family microcompartment protein [Clostridium aminobutyricum]|uniref:EutN/CcmL family microcompartment protein n=1 Tax=Clostridium aminobutyricum TaxID=33953 RepID=A0A939D9X8_CLOAM|nr:EutN/CcmL family microcompartment protein [Clostridium aminobutyricum]MBN7773810.1 EutN/CcmL family microcompartment protein [Clostridium aminobutyricum]